MYSGRKSSWKAKVGKQNLAMTVGLGLFWIYQVTFDRLLAGCQGTSL